MIFVKILYSVTRVSDYDVI